MASIKGLATLNSNSLGTEKIIAFKTRHAWVLNGSTWELAPDASAGRYFATDANIEHAEFLDQTFLVDGSTPPRNYDNSTWSFTRNLNGSPIAKYIRLFNNRLYMANIKLQVPGVSGGVLSFPSRVWYSNIPEQDADGNWTIKWNYESGNDLYVYPDANGFNSTVFSPSATFLSNGIISGDSFYILSGSNAGKYTVASVDSETDITLTKSLATNTVSNLLLGSYWVGGNWFDVAFDDGDEITGLGDNSGRLLVFKKNSLHKTPFNGDNLEKVKGALGTYSHRSIGNLGDFTYYHNPEGFYRYNGVNSQLISEPVWDIIEGISSSVYDEIVFWTDGARFVKFFVGDISVNLQTDLPAITNCALVHDVSQETWSTQALAHTITCTVPWIESSTPKIFAGFTDGNVYQLETGTDFDGAAIPFRLRTKVYYPVAPEVDVTGERIEEYADRGDNLQVTYRRVKQPKARDSDFKPLAKAFPVNESDFRGIQFEVLESSTKDSFALEQLTVYYSNERLEE